MSLQKNIRFRQLSGKNSNDLIIVLVTANDTEDETKLLRFIFRFNWLH